MSAKLKTAILAVAIVFAATFTLCAQNYTLSPGDSIVANAPMDDLMVFNILQNNNSSDTLFLSWEKISADIPSGWEAVICDNSNCYADLKEDGIMLPVIPSEYGLLSIHITPHLSVGTAFIQYGIWESGNTSVVDTLTWLISSGITAITQAEVDEPMFWLSGNRLVIQHPSFLDRQLSCFDILGKLLFQQRITSAVTTIDLTTFPKGICFVNLTSDVSHITRKIFIE